MLLLAWLLAQAPSPLPQGHPALSGNPAPTAEELIKKLDAAPELKGKEKSFEIASSMGRLYLLHGRYADARTFLLEAMQKTEPLRTLNRAYNPTAARCPASDLTVTHPFETLAAKAVAEGNPVRAASCAHDALLATKETSNQLAQTYFLTAEPQKAIDQYTWAIDLDDDVEAHYGRAAVLLDSRGDALKALAMARSDLELFLKRAATTSPRAPQANAFLGRVNAALEAKGLSKLKRAAPAEKPSGFARPLTPEMVEAVQNVERTPAMEKGFNELVEQAEAELAKGQFQQALDKYKRVVPFQPENARARAGMAWSLVRLNKPMADNVWRVASAHPEALDTLAQTLKAKGDASGAQALWTRLKETVPSYADKLHDKL